MRKILIALILALAALPAAAQDQPQSNACAAGANGAPDAVIQGCTDFIQAGGRTDDQLAAAYNNRGLGYRAKNLLDPAIADFTTAVSLRPDYRESYFNRGLAYGEKGMTDQAIADFSKVIALKPDFSAAYTLRGYSYETEKESALAVADYRMALKLNPQDKIAAQGLARLGAP